MSAPRVQLMGPDEAIYLDCDLWFLVVHHTSAFRSLEHYQSLDLKTCTLFVDGVAVPKPSWMTADEDYQ